MKSHSPNFNKMKRLWNIPGWILIFLFSLIAFVLVVGGIRFYRNQAQSIREVKINELKSIAELKINQLVQWKKERLSDARLNSSDPFMNQVVNQWVLEPNDIASETDIEARLQLLMDLHDYRNVFLTTPDGHLLFSLDPSIKEVESDIQLLAVQSVTAGEPLLGNFYRSSDTHQIFLDVASTIDNEDGQPVAVLILQVDPEKYLYPLIQSWPTPSQSAETLIIRQDGEDVLFLNTLRHNNASPMTLRIPMTKTNVPAVAAVLGQTGEFDGVDYRGVNVAAEILPIPGTPWFMIAKIDTVEMLSEVRTLGWAVLLFVALSMLMTAVLGAYTFNYRQRLLYRTLFRAEQERTEAQEETRITLYSIGDGVITTDKDGNVTRINPAAENLTGWSEAEAKGKPLVEVFQIINEMSRLEVENPVERVLREGQVVGLANHTLLIARDGTERPIADSGAPIKNERGNINGVVLVFRDQTQERAALKELALLNYTISTSLNEIFLFDSETLCFRFVNDGGLKNLGYSMDQMRTMTPLDIKPEFTLETFQQMLQPLVEHKKSVLVVEAVHRRADGSYYPIEAHLQLFEYENERVFLTVVNDITERKRAEKILRESEARFRAIIEQSFDGVLVLDEALRIVEWNTAQTKIFGFTREEMMGKALWDYQFATVPDEQKSPELLDTLKEQMLDAVNTRDFFRVDLLDTRKVQTKDGSYKMIQVSSFSIEVSGGKLYCSIIRDITAEQAAEQNYQMLFREMLDGFAMHEIILDHKGTPADYRFISVNPAFERMTGLKDADIRGRTVLEVLPGTEQYWIDIYGQVALTGKPAFFENYARELGKYFEVTAFHSAPNQFATIFTDITERKRAEISLKSAYTKLEALWGVAAINETRIEAISDHILTTLAQMTGSEYGFYGFVDPNEEILTIHSWTGDAMKDCSIVDKPQHFPVDEAGIWAEAIRRREPLILNDYSAPDAAKKGLPDGHVTLTNLLVVPHFSHGKITTVAAVANRLEDYNADDIAQINTFLISVQALVDSKLAEKALLESEDKFRYVFDHSVIGKSLTRPSGEIDVNKAFCEMLGYTEEELQNKKWQEITHPDDIALAQIAIDSLLLGEKESVRFNKRYLHKNGTVVWADVSTSLRCDEAGEPLYFVTAIVNITERKQQEMQLKEQVEELRRWHKITLGRENRILELKSEVNKALIEAGKSPRYASAQENSADE